MRGTCVATGVVALLAASAAGAPMVGPGPEARTEPLGLFVSEPFAIGPEVIESGVEPRVAWVFDQSLRAFPGGIDAAPRPPKPEAPNPILIPTPGTAALAALAGVVLLLPRKRH